ncbi:MAG: hypothetical protein ACKV2U_24805 [Bryobacteraceae bacterium]
MAWTNTTKDWEYHRPIHRINSPTYDPSRTRATGKGYGRGCHAPSDGPDDSVYGLIIRELARAIPGWVSVLNEDEHEVEGVLDRCFQTWTDVPLYQWHRYYDWNFHLIPSEGYTYLRGMGNEPGGHSELEPEQRPVTAPDSMECEWDCGSFGQRPGAMYNNPQWIWPMTGQYCWIAGRWIYDCGHASSNTKTGANQGLMRTELHPCKAMATAQWEAVAFPENGGLFVPGIRFQFFASRLGGYKDFAKLNDSDYEFVVDLPRLQGPGTLEMSIDRTPDFPLSTAVLRSTRLLHKLTFISTATGSAGQIDPIIKEKAPAAQGGIAEQVEVRIPLSQLPDSCDYYGVIVDFGWLDPDRSQARRVKHCRIEFENVHKGSEDHDVFDEEWLVKFAVNGRWHIREFRGVESGDKLRLNQTEEFHLSEDDWISVTSHGADLNPVDDVFHRNIPDRTLSLNGRAMNWDADIVPSTGQPLWDMCYEAADMMFWTFNDQNTPIGIVDPGKGASDNPLPVRTLDFTNNLRHTQVAKFTEEVGDSAELAENIRLTDYSLNYLVSVNPQQVS